MNEKELINQLKSLRNIHPDQSWVISTRSRLNESAQTSNQSAQPRLAVEARRAGISGIFNFMVPKTMAVSLLAAIVVMVGGGIAVFQEGFDAGHFVGSVRHKSLSIETKKELKEIADYAEARALLSGTAPAVIDGQEPVAYTVIFKENADEQELFIKALRDRIEAKIRNINDLFAQLDDGDLTREIILNTRKFEENFEKLADGEIAAQVRILLKGAQTALDEGNLIDALDLVVAIDKLLK